MKTAFADEKICKKIKKYTRLGICIIHEYEDAEFSVNNYEADIIENHRINKALNERK